MLLAAYIDLELKYEAIYMHAGRAGDKKSSNRIKETKSDAAEWQLINGPWDPLHLCNDGILNDGISPRLLIR